MEITLKAREDLSLIKYNKDQFNSFKKTLNRLIYSDKKQLFFSNYLLNEINTVNKDILQFTVGWFALTGFSLYFNKKITK